MIQAVAFDLDSTLTDFLRFKRLATESAALAMVDAGLDMSPDLAMQRLWEVYRAAGLDGDVAFDRFLRETVGRVDAHVHAAGLGAYLRTKDTHLEPYPRTLETLVDLTRRGLRLAVITDAERPKAHHRLSRLRIAPFFEVVITLDDTLRGKGDTQPFRMLARLLQLSPRDILMVGDNPLRDVRPAKEAGYRTALAEYGAQPHYASIFAEDTPDFRLRRIDDLVRVVDGLGTPLAWPPLPGPRHGRSAAPPAEAWPEPEPALS
jgi:putative hydrolase of the HAD superfamily